MSHEDGSLLVCILITGFRIRIEREQAGLKQARGGQNKCDWLPTEAGYDLPIPEPTGG